MLNLFGKIGKLCRILCIRTPGGKLSGDRMFRNGGNCRNHLKASLLCGILQFYQRILIGAVAIDTNQNGSGTVAMYHAQPLYCYSGNTTTIGRHGNDCYILFCQ